MLDFLASLTMEQQAMIVAFVTFGIVWAIKRCTAAKGMEYQEDKMRYYVHAVVWSLVVAAVQNAGDFSWQKWFAAAIVGFLGSQGLYTSHKAAKRLL